MRTFKLTIAYEGTAYCGWQRQVDKPTVQGALEDTLRAIADSEPKTLASGRTDAGVHALRQVVGVRLTTRLPSHVLHQALNARLPGDIAVLSLEEVDAAFHPIRDAVAKRYRYLIYDGPRRQVFWRRFCWHYRYGRLDAEAMHRAAQSLLGRHDFRSFASQGSDPKTTIRTLHALDVTRADAASLVPVFVATTDGAGQGGAGQGGDCPDFHSQPRSGDMKMGLSPLADGVSLLPTSGDWIVVEATANGFLYNMVRTLVGSLVDVGRGVRSDSWPGEVLASCDRRRAGPNAPPQGLFLDRVWYK